MNKHYNADNNTLIPLIYYKKYRIKKWLDSKIKINNYLPSYNSNYNTNEQSEITENTLRVRDHVDYLFKQLVNRCNYKNMFVEGYINDEIINMLPIFDESFRDAFYEFCYDNSSKKNQINI